MLQPCVLKWPSFSCGKPDFRSRAGLYYSYRIMKSFINEQWNLSQLWNLLGTLARTRWHAHPGKSLAAAFSTILMVEAGGWWVWGDDLRTKVWVIPHMLNAKTGACYNRCADCLAAYWQFPYQICLLRKFKEEESTHVCVLFHFTV